MKQYSTGWAWHLLNFSSLPTLQQVLGHGSGIVHHRVRMGERELEESHA